MAACRAVCFTLVLVGLAAAVGCEAPDLEPSALPSGPGAAALGRPIPLEVCLDAREVVPPPLATGICLGAGAALLDCAGDADCPAERSCRCGRCLPRLCEADAACGPDERCAEDGVCRAACWHDRDCPAGLPRCVAGECRQPCAVPADCAEGQTCAADSGVCRAAHCDGRGAGCPGGTACRQVRVALDLREPAVLPPAAAGEPWMLWAESRGAEGSNILQAESSDGLRWELQRAASGPAPALEARRDWEGEGVHAPSVLRLAPEQWLMVYAADEGRGLGLAFSNSGRTFAAEPTPLMTPTLAWEGAALRGPALAHFDGEFLLAYAGDFGLGLAALDLDSSQALRLADAQGSVSPAYSPAQAEQPGPWSRLRQLASPSLLSVPRRSGGELLWLHFAAWPSASELEDAPDAPGIGAAVAAPGEAFLPFPAAPLLGGGAGPDVWPELGGPCAVDWEGRRRVYVHAASPSDGPARLVLARDDEGLPR